MKSILYLFLIHMTLLGSRGEDVHVNYCGAKMCRNTDAHTFCQYPVGPSPHCLGYMRSRLSPTEKIAIVGRLNRRRNDAASGRLQGLPSAANMMRLHWVEELALGAQRWADQCRPPRIPEENDACRDLFTITVGQAVASVVGDAPGLLVETMVDIWFLQNLQYKGIVTSYPAPPLNASYYGDFAQMIWGRTYLVGCGRSRFMSSVGGRLRSVIRLVCNFAPRGPAPRYPLWTPGAPASICPSQSVQDPDLPALCDFYVLDGKDMYYYNKFLEEDYNITKTRKNKKKVKKHRRSNQRTTVQLIGRPKTYDVEDLYGSNDDLEAINNDLDDSNTPRTSTEVLNEYELLHDDALISTRAPPNISSVTGDDELSKRITGKVSIEINEINNNEITNNKTCEVINSTIVDDIKELIQEKIKELGEINQISKEIVEEKILQNIKSIDLGSVVTAREQLPNYNFSTRAGKVRRDLKTLHEQEKTTTTTADVSNSTINNNTDNVTELTNETNELNNSTTAYITETVSNTEKTKTKRVTEYDDYDDEKADETTVHAGEENESDDDQVDVSTESTMSIILRFMPYFSGKRVGNTTLLADMQNNLAMTVSPAFILLLTCVL